MDRGKPPGSPRGRHTALEEPSGGSNLVITRGTTDVLDRTRRDRMATGPTTVRTRAVAGTTSRPGGMEGTATLRTRVSPTGDSPTVTNDGKRTVRDRSDRSAHGRRTRRDRRSRPNHQQEAWNRS